MTPVQTTLATGLQELARFVATTERTRSLTEAPVAHTNAYAGYMLACGLGSVGAHDAARAMVAEARAGFETLLRSDRRHRRAGPDDRIRGFLQSAFEARVEQAIAGVPYGTALPEALQHAYRDLDRLERYKVDRLRESSRLLEPEPIDAIEAFSRRSLLLPTSSPTS